MVGIDEESPDLGGVSGRIELTGIALAGAVAAEQRAAAAIECAETVAALLAKELNKDLAWQRAQVEEFEKLAGGYLVNFKK